MSHEKNSSRKSSHGSFSPERSPYMMMDSSANESNTKEHQQPYEKLFDSGYNSNVQSKTFLDLENLEFDSTQQQSGSTESKTKSTTTATSKSTFDSSTVVQQWTDSGVCITDSGLSIQDDSCCDMVYTETTTDTEVDTKEPTTEVVENQQQQNSLELWLKHKSDGDTLLHLAIIEGLEDIACSIIQNVSSSNEMLTSYNYLYQNPLHLAVLKRQMNVIQQLLLKGPSNILMTFQDSFGNTPLHIACKYSLYEIVELFLSPFGTTTTNNNTANYHNHRKAISKCFEIKNYDGDTCLHLAAYNNDLRTLELLLRAGANVNIQEGKSGKTILHWAVENLQVHLVQFLLRHQHHHQRAVAIDIQCQTFGGHTPLHYLLKSTNFGTKNESSALPSVMVRAKIHKILRLAFEFCREQQLSWETMMAATSSPSSSSGTDSDQDDEDMTGTPVAVATSG